MSFIHVRRHLALRNEVVAKLTEMLINLAFSTNIDVRVLYACSSYIANIVNDLKQINVMHALN